MLELVDAIYHIGNGDPVRRVSAFQALNRSHDSGLSRQLVSTASGNYGLITGNSTAPLLGLTERGLAIAAATNEDARHSASLDALFDNEVFETFVTKYSDRSMPNIEVAADFVASTFNFSEPDARLCVAIMIENIRDFGLIETSGSRELVVSRATAEAMQRAPKSSPPEVDLFDSLFGSGSRTLGQSSVVESEASNSGDEPRPSDSLHKAVAVDSSASSQWRNSTMPQIAFNVQIQLPSDATPETYQAIFENIAKYLLGRDEE